MKVDIKAITNVTDKVSALTTGDKTIPGILLDIQESNEMKVCYSDNHKSLIEKIPVELEEGDFTGRIVVSYEQFTRAIANSQPSGIIKVENIKFTILDNHIIKLEADQNLETLDENGEVTGNRKMASKKMDISWIEPDSDMKSRILTRMKYDEIFEPEGIYDTYNKAELIDALGRTAVEKGRQIYVSANNQMIFVANTAHVTAIPISSYDLTEDDRNEIASGIEPYNEETFKEQCLARMNRVHSSLVIPQNIAKSLISILNKTVSEDVFIYTENKYCNIFIENDDETLGIWFEMAQATKAHIGSLGRYSSYAYKTYQLMFLREFLDNNIKSAINVTKSEKVQFKFEKTDSEDSVTPLDLVIGAGNAGASIADTYRINPDAIVDPTETLESQSFTVPLKVFYDMLSQLKTELVALDFDVNETGIICIRLAEIDMEKMQEEYMKARQGLSDDTPTPIEAKLNLRENTLRVRQYTMLPK